VVTMITSVLHVLTVNVGIVLAVNGLLLFFLFLLLQLFRR
jgi:hypothetical protein